VHQGKRPNLHSNANRRIIRGHRLKLNPMKTPAKTVKEEYEHRKQLTEEAKQRRDALLLQLLRTPPESREELKRKAKATSKRAMKVKKPI
jgi:hypothetical protein